MINALPVARTVQCRQLTWEVRPDAEDNWPVPRIRRRYLIVPLWYEMSGCGDDWAVAYLACAMAPLVSVSMDPAETQCIMRIVRTILNGVVHQLRFTTEDPYDVRCTVDSSGTFRML